MTGLFDLVSLGIAKLETKDEGKIDVLVASTALTITHYQCLSLCELPNRLKPPLMCGLALQLDSRLTKLYFPRFLADSESNTNR